MASLDAEIAELVKALARAAVSRDRAARKKPRRAHFPVKEDTSGQPRRDGDPDAHTDIRKI
jgi:hypothetical protein